MTVNYCIYRTRLSLRELELEENATKKNDFLKAWRELKKKSPDDDDSFWSIASYHGMPFKARQVDPKVIPPNEDNNSAWNGYCQHANILFPTWHRFYCLKLERALQKAFPEGDVALHYWDETSEPNLADGLPPIVLDKMVKIDGVPEDNPLLSFTLPRDIDRDNSLPDKNAKYYAKPLGYSTVRYPLSGIVTPEESKDIAEKHNSSINGPTELLKENLVHWLNEGRVPSVAVPTNSVHKQFEDCLGVSSYNKFSNTSSSNGGACLESPHNSIHLAVGGFTTPSQLADGNPNPDYVGLIEGSNGDMGENETAAFDPIFFLHHCNIDRMFWLWQNKYGYLTDIPLDANEGDPGRSNEGQGPTPYQGLNDVLGWETKLHPFKDQGGNLYNSTQCFDISTLGYAYSIGSLDDRIGAVAPYGVPGKPLKHAYLKDTAGSFEEIVRKVQEEAPKHSIPINVTFDISRFSLQIPPLFMPKEARPATGRDVGYDDPVVLSAGNTRFETRFSLNVENLQKSMVPGSFVVQAYYRKNEKLFFIGQRAVLDRWDRTVCQNCQTRPNTTVGFAIDQVLAYCKDIKNVEVHIVSKDPTTGKQNVQIMKQDGPPSAETYAMGVAGKPSFHIVANLKQQLFGSA